MRVADTSYLYALFSETDVFHERARQAARSPELTIIPSEIFAETVSLVQYRVGFAAARSAGDWMRAQAGLRFAPGSGPVLDRAWAIYTTGRGRLSFPDAIVLSWCQELGATPLAFDEAIVRHSKGSSAKTP